MLDQTIDAFTNGNQVAAADTLIQGWLDALKGDPNVDAIKQALQDLHDQLHRPQPDAERIRDLLTGMAAQAADMAQGPNAEGTWTGKLERMAKLLDQFGRDL